jgi:hypothetical protein
MARDPSLEVYKSAILAELLGTSVNAFTQPLDWKAIAFIFLLLLT